MFLLDRTKFIQSFFNIPKQEYIYIETDTTLSDNEKQYQNTNSENQQIQEEQSPTLLKSDDNNQK